MPTEPTLVEQVRAKLSCPTYPLSPMQCDLCRKKAEEIVSLVREAAAKACECPEEYTGGPSPTRRGAWDECAAAIRNLR